MTDLYGLMYKPYDFDPQKQYGVIDSIYGGNRSMMELHASFEPQWGLGGHSRALAQLGYIVVVMDSRGTLGRSKQFQDVNLREAMIPDHVAGIRELAKRHSFIDLDRVGVLGTSAGGNATLRAMFTAPKVFRVGVATEFRVEPGDQLLQLAGNLKGRLLLVHGEPAKSSVERMARALIDAERFFDVLPLPGSDHAISRDEHYWFAAIGRYFDQHLK